jgi:hypothetical protein
MASLKYRVDYEVENKHGQWLGYTRWLGGPTLARVRCCQCGDNVRRTAYVTAEPDTFFSQPARINIGKKSLKGFLTVEDDLWTFHVENT